MGEPSKDSKNLKQKAVRGVFWSLVEKLGSQGTQFITFLVLARLLAPESFGLISLANIFVHFIQALVDSGFSDAIIQRKRLEEDHLNTAFWTNLGVGTVLSLTGVFTAGAIAAFFKQPGLTPIVAWLSLNVLINSFASTQQAIFRRQLNFRGLAQRKVFGLVAGGIVGVTMAFLGYGVWSLVCQTLVGNTLGTLLLWRISDWRPQLKFSAKHLQDLASYGVNVIGIGILVFVTRRVDDFLIGYFLGPTALGYYTIAYKLFLMIIQLLQEGTRKVSLPTFSKLQENKLELQRAFLNTTAITCLISFPAFLGLAAIAPELVSVVFGEQWLPSIPVMQILAFNGVLVSATTFIGPVIMAVGKPFWNLMLILVNTVVKIIAFLLVVQKGIIFIAIALVASSYLALPSRLWVMNRLAGISWLKLCQQFVAPFVASIAMVLCILGTKYVLQQSMTDQWLLGIYIIVGIVSYSLAAWLLAPHLFRKLCSALMSSLPAKRFSG